MKINIRKPLKKFAPNFLQARKDKFNEANTVQYLCRFFEEVLGYDGLQDISREVNINDKYIDICLKIDEKVHLLVEAKSAVHQLRDHDIEQAQRYASEKKLNWVLLTNGVDWQLYHLTFKEGIKYEHAFLVSLGDEGALDEAAQKLGILHKQSIQQGDLDLFWKKATALSATSIGKVLFSESVLRLLRRELRREKGLLIDSEDLAKSIHEMLCKEAREQIGPLHIRKRRSFPRKPDQAIVKNPATPERQNVPDSSSDPISQGS